MYCTVEVWKRSLVRAVELGFLALALGSLAPRAWACDPDGDYCNPAALTCCNQCALQSICCSRGESVDGKKCTSGKQCCTGHCSNILGPVSFGTCCSEADQACSSDADCCPNSSTVNTLECDTVSTHECCMPTDGKCTAGNQCCSGLCVMPGPLPGKCSCSGVGHFCEANTDCCSHLSCSTKGSCCIPKGGACTSAAGCCSGICSNAGICG
jgi:hypothetical protein